MSERKTVFITGASRGIGHATATYFVDRGWRAITCSRDEVPPQCPRDERHEHITVDLAQTHALPGTIERLHNILGGEALHALVNNAGYSPKGEGGSRLGCLDGDLGVWERTYAINFFAPVYFSRACAPLLAETGGSIVNITSIAGHAIHPFAGSAYSTSKAALSALTREMAVEFADLGVRVNAVAPGEIETAMIGPEYETLIPRIPMHRMGKPEEVAATVYRLCTEDFGYVTGTEIFVTGGQHLY
jgi:NAD(P)-dependent dehydrogenase (short-subunit alcohol dehydrogenase family)